jgi:hypothetical protein
MNGWLRRPRRIFSVHGSQARLEKIVEALYMNRTRKLLEKNGTAENLLLLAGVMDCGGKAKRRHRFRPCGNQTNRPRLPLGRRRRGASLPAALQDGSWAVSRSARNKGPSMSQPFGVPRLRGSYRLRAELQTRNAVKAGCRHGRPFLWRMDGGQGGTHPQRASARRRAVFDAGSVPACQSETWKRLAAMNRL